METGDRVHWVITHFLLGHCKIQTLHDSIFSDPNPVLFLKRVFEQIRQIDYQSFSTFYSDVQYFSMYFNMFVFLAPHLQPKGQQKTCHYCTSTMPYENISN